MNTAFKFFLTVIFIISGLSLSAQSNQIQTTKAEYKDRQVDALVMEVKPSRKDVQKAFGDWMSEQYNTKMKGGGLFGDKTLQESGVVVISSVSDENLNFIARTEETNGMTQIYLFASKGQNNFVQRDEEAFTGLEGLFDAFLSDYMPGYYESRLAEAEQMLADLEKEYEGVEKDLQKNQSDIQALTKDNEQLRANLAALMSKLKKVQGDLRTRRAGRGKAPAKLGKQGG